MKHLRLSYNTDYGIDRRSGWSVSFDGRLDQKPVAAPADQSSHKEFKPGDVVQLASGGPKMIIMGLPEKPGDNAHLGYWNGASFQEIWLPAHVLRGAPEGDPK